MNRGCDRSGQGGMLRQKIPGAFVFARELGAQFFRAVQLAGLALPFQFPQQRHQPGQAEGGAGAGATMRHLTDDLGVIHANRRLQLRKLFRGLLEVKVQQFAQTFRTAAAQIQQPVHLHW